MPTAFTLPEFWFGLLLLGAFQAAKFSEVSSSDAAVRDAFSGIPDLRANDFAGSLAFFTSLSAFLSVTFLIYLVLCGLSPDLLSGWAKVTGVQGNPEQFARSVPYPLYIAAVLMGLAQPGIPAFSSFGNVQRNVFHTLMGVPKKNVDVSVGLADQLIARASDKQGLAAQVLRITEPSWIGNVQKFVDTTFYDLHVRRLKLDETENRNEIATGSMRELKLLIRQMVLIGVLATIRKSGAKGLPKLAQALGVVMPERPITTLPRDYTGSIVLTILVLTVLWFAIPMFHSAAWTYLRAQIDFWPGDLEYSGQYLLSNVVPIFISVVIALTMCSRHQPVMTTPGKTTFQIFFDNDAPVILSVLLAVLLYDLAQALYDFGNFQPSQMGSASKFLLSNLPFYLLHSFISIATCFTILTYVQRKMTFFMSGVSILVAVGFISTFYAMARLHFQYQSIGSYDFVVIIVVISEVAALLALVSASLVTARLRTLVPAGVN